MLSDEDLQSVQDGVGYFACRSGEQDRKRDRDAGGDEECLSARVGIGQIPDAENSRDVIEVFAQLRWQQDHDVLG